MLVAHAVDDVPLTCPPRWLSNVAATLLSLMGYTPPEGYDPALISFKR
jgi:hypothetical protein